MIKLIKRYIQYRKRVKALKNAGWKWKYVDGRIMIHDNYGFYLTRKDISSLPDTSFIRLINGSKPSFWFEVIR